MRERRARVPSWVERRLSRSVWEEVFEPAYHELLADHAAAGARHRSDLSRALAAVALWVRIRVIEWQSLRLQAMRRADWRTERQAMMSAWRDLRVAWRGLVRRPAIDVFGVMSLLVATQQREMGVRMAMGARPLQLLSMVLKRTLGLAGAGVVIGLLAAAGLSRVDPMTSLRKEA